VSISVKNVLLLFKQIFTLSQPSYLVYTHVKHLVNLFSFASFASRRGNPFAVFNLS